MRLARLPLVVLWATVCLCFICSNGCNRGQDQPPAPLAVEEIPTEMQKIFTKAPPEVKAVVDQLLGALQSKDYTLAYQLVQSLGAMSELTKPQGILAGRAALTITDLLQSAQAQGDPKAAATLKDYQNTR